MEVTFCSLCDQSIPAKDASNWKNDEGNPLCKVCHYGIRREITRADQADQADQNQARMQRANKLAGLSLVAALTLMAVLFGAHSCKVPAEAEREQRIQKVLRETRAEFQASIDSTLAKVATPSKTEPEVDEVPQPNSEVERLKREAARTDDPEPDPAPKPIAAVEKRQNIQVSPKTIRMFPLFPGGRVKWGNYDLPVVPATRRNVRAYRVRMAEFYGEFARSARCYSKRQRQEQAGRFIIQSDKVIGFGGVKVPDSYVEWTKLFVKVIQNYTESMYYEDGIPELEFFERQKHGDLHGRANRMLEDLTRNPKLR
jgi:hypothetical protein